MTKVSAAEASSIRFIKLKQGEDMVAFFLGETETHITVRRPLAVRIENDFSSGRQLLEVREWLPPILTDVEEATINKADIMIITAVRESFVEEFVNVVNYFYSVRPKKQETKAIVDRADSKNVLPFFGRDTSNKPN
jgi:hypothetical protein